MPAGAGGRGPAEGHSPGGEQDRRTSTAGTTAGQARPQGREGRVDRAQHIPVLAGRVADLLVPALSADGAVLVDATLGRAGHARALLEACPGLLLIGVDADVAAIEAGRVLLAPFAHPVTLV